MMIREQPSQALQHRRPCVADLFALRQNPTISWHVREMQDTERNDPQAEYRILQVSVICSMFATRIPL